MRLSALAVVAMLGSGCIVHNTNDGYVPPPVGYGDVRVFWEFMRNAPAANVNGFVIYDESLAAVNASGVCPESDVDTVRLESSLGTVDVACTGPVTGGGYSQGYVLRSLPAGSNSIRVTGFRGGQAVYRSTVNVPVPSAGVVDRIVTVQGISAGLELYGYLFNSGFGQDYLTCAEALDPNIDFWLWDSFGTLVESGSTSCSDPLPSITFAGFADLDNYTVRMQGFSVPADVMVFDTCNQAFNHFGAQTGGLGVTADLLTNPVPTCP